MEKDFNKVKFLENLENKCLELAEKNKNNKHKLSK